MKEVGVHKAISDLKSLTFGSRLDKHSHNAKVYVYANIRIYDGTEISVPEWVKGYALLKKYVSGTTLRINWHRVRSNKGHEYNDCLSIELAGKEK